MSCNNMISSLCQPNPVSHYCIPKTSQDLTWGHFIQSGTDGRSPRWCITRAHSCVPRREKIAISWERIHHTRGLQCAVLPTGLKGDRVENTWSLMPYHSSPLLRTHAFNVTSVKASLYNTTSNTEPSPLYWLCS